MTKEDIKGLVPGTVFAPRGYPDYHKAPWYAIVRQGWNGVYMVIDSFYRGGSPTVSPGYRWIPNKDVPTYIVYEIPLLPCLEEW